MCVEVRVEVGYDSVYQGFGDSGNIGNILHEAHLAAFEQGSWRAKIVIIRLQDDLPLEDISIATMAKDATEWDNCVNGFQTQLHSLLYPTITELFGVSYRGRKGHEVVVKTVVDEGGDVRHGLNPPHPQGEHTLEILLFWRNDSMTGVQMRPHRSLTVANNP